MKGRISKEILCRGDFMQRTFYAKEILCKGDFKEGDFMQRRFCGMRFTQRRF